MSDVVEYPISGGKAMTLIDVTALSVVAARRWHLTSQGYVATRVSRVPARELFMHRLIMSAPTGIQVDHINRRRLDNRRCNLRFASQSQQSANSGIWRTNRSGYRGVSWDAQQSRWVARIRCARSNRSLNLGRFTDPVEAAAAYDTAAFELFGEFATLNFPPTP